MSLLEAAGILLAGLAAGSINAVAGSGTLVTFPALLAVGLPPITANVTNGLGLVPGSIAAVHQYREELRGHWRGALGLALWSGLGAIAGAILLLALPAEWFRYAAPVLIAIALVLVVAGPRISAWVTARRTAGRVAGRHSLPLGIGLTGVYGGYFGAGQGIVLFALLGTALPDEIQRVNALKNLFAGTANAVSALVFVLIADIDFRAAGLIAVGAVAGGILGARIGRRLSPGALRGLVVAVGIAAIVQLLL